MRGCFLTIYHLFPDMLNLYGDKGNMAVLTKRCEWRGIGVRMRTLTSGGEPDFGQADIVLFGGGSNREQRLVSHYSDRLAPPLQEYIEQGGVTLAVCAGFQLLGRFYEVGGERIPCLGILDIATVSGPDRLIGNVVMEARLGEKTVTLVGFENHAGRTDIGGHMPLGTVKRGFGNDGRGTYEGVCYKNTIATYLHGPVLPKNPELADFLIERALGRKYPDLFVEGLPALDDTAEAAARRFVVEREVKKRGFGGLLLWPSRIRMFGLSL